MRKVLMVACAALLAVAGCSGTKEATPGGEAPKQRLRFAVIPKALEIPVFNYAKIGAERQA